MSTARAGGAAGDIADDLLPDIFARLRGSRDLLRCAATCKRWHRLVTDRAFLRRVGLWPDTAPHPSVLAGVFSQDTAVFSWSSFEKGRPRCPPQFLTLQAGGDGRLTFDSFFPDDAGLLNYARPLASRRGLLLVRVFLPSSDCSNPIYQKLQLGVCRPYPMGDKHLLPTPAFDMIGLADHDFTGYAILTDEDYAGDVGNLDHRQQHTFRVVLNYTINYTGIASACTYSSATGSWSAPIKCWSPSYLIRCGPHAGVVIGSIVHWLYMGKDMNFYTLNVNTTTSHVSMTKIPIKAHNNTHELLRPPVPCITGEGVLSFVTIQQDHGVLELWTKQGEDDSNHDHGCEEGWQHSELTNFGSKKINIVFFAESRGALLIKQDGVFITLDLKSGEKMLVDLKYEKIGHISGTGRFGENCSSTYCRGHYGDRSCTSLPPVLYELDWVFNRRMFPTSSRLGDKIGTD